MKIVCSIFQIRRSPLRLIAAVVLGLAAAAVSAADTGVYTIVEGTARVLRGATWFKLAAGARVQDGDILDLRENAQVQFELAGGRAIDLLGPASVHVAGAAASGAKTVDGAEAAIQRGWFKVAGSGTSPLRLRPAAMSIDVGDAVVVVHADGASVELFVESGTVKIALPQPRGKSAVTRDVTTGEFLSRSGDRSPVFAARPPAAFVTAMPREFRDRLPALAAHFPKDVELTPVGDVALQEAEPWLAGANRKPFLKRFGPRLADPAFRAAVIARASTFPEWDRVLRPERYRPREPDATNPSAASGAMKANTR